MILKIFFQKHLIIISKYKSSELIKQFKMPEKNAYKMGNYLIINLSIF